MKLLVRIFLVVFLSLTVLPASGLTESFDRALVERAVNEVLIYQDITAQDPTSKPVVAGEDYVQENQGLKTGIDSKAQLQFSDETVVRIGDQSVVSFAKGERSLQIPKGAALIQGGRTNERTAVQTATATASLTGTTLLVEERPGEFTKTIVLEGEVKVEHAEDPFETETVTGGEMMVMAADARTLPEPVPVDMEELAQSSNLIEEFNEQGQLDEESVNQETSIDVEPIQEVIENQQEEMTEGDLESTDLVIEGDGTDVSYHPVEEESNNQGNGEDTFQDAVEDQTQSGVDDQTQSGVEDQTQSGVDDQTQSDDEQQSPPSEAELAPPTTLNGQTSLTLDSYPTVTDESGNEFYGAFYDPGTQTEPRDEWALNQTLNSSGSVDLAGYLERTSGSNGFYRYLSEEWTLDDDAFQDVTINDNNSHVALTSQGNLTVASNNDLTPTLDSLTLLSQSGDITVNEPIKNSGGDLGLFTDAGQMTVAADLRADGETYLGGQNMVFQNVTFNPFSGPTGVRAVTDNTKGDLNASGEFRVVAESINSSDYLRMIANQDLNLSSNTIDNEDLDSTSISNPQLDSPNNLDLQTQGNLTLADIGIQAPELGLRSTNGGTIEIGNVNLSAQDMLKIYSTQSGGAVNFVDNTWIYSDGGEVHIAAETVDITSGTDIILNNSDGDVYIYTASGNLDVDGEIIDDSWNGSVNDEQNLGDQPAFH